MSFNVGDTINNATALFPSPVAKTLTPVTAAVSGVNNDAETVAATVESLALSPLAAQINEDVIVQPTLGTRTKSAFNSAVDFVPVQGDVQIDATTGTRTFGPNNTFVNTGGAAVFPSFADEAAAYAARGMTEANIVDYDVSTATSAKITNFENQTSLGGWVGTPNLSDTLLHDLTEADPLWIAVRQKKRMTDAGRTAAANIWTTRAANMAAYFTNNYYASDEWNYEQANRQHAHLYGYGLCDWAELESDAAAITTINNMVTGLSAWRSSYTPGDALAGSASYRGWGRLLWFVARAAAVSPTGANITFFNKIVDIMIQAPDWDPVYKNYWYWESATADQGATTFADGLRTQVTSHAGLVLTGFYHAYRTAEQLGDTTRLQQIGERIIDMATFYRDIDLAGDGNFGRRMGWIIPAYAGSGQPPVPNVADPRASVATLVNDGHGGVSQTDAIYNHPPVNGLVMAYKLTGDHGYLDRAWYLWQRWQASTEAEQGANVSFGEVHHYADSQIGPNGTYILMANNKSELQYMELLLENSGQPLLETGMFPSYVSQKNNWIDLATLPNTNLYTTINQGCTTAQCSDFSRITAWNGGAVRKNSFVRGPEGGHFATANNQVDELDDFLDPNGPTWIRRIDATPTAQVIEDSSHYLDGHPTSRHGRGTPVILEGLNGLHDSLAYPYCVDNYGNPAGTFDNCDVLRLYDWTWYAEDTYQQNPEAATADRAVAFAFDRNTGTVIGYRGRQGRTLYKWNPVTDTYSGAVSADIGSGGSYLFAAPEHRMLFGAFGIDGGTTRFWVINLDNLADRRELSPIGTWVDQGGYAYSPRAGGNGAVILWTSNPSQRLEKVRIPTDAWVGGTKGGTLSTSATWTSETVSTSGSPPSLTVTNGMHGNFNYIPVPGVIFAQTDADQGGYVIRVED